MIGSDMEDEEISGENTPDPVQQTPNRQLTDAEWAEIVEHYELGTKNGKMLADEFGVSRQSLSERFKRYGIVRGSRAHEVQQTVKKTVTQAVQQSAERYADKRMTWIEDTKVESYKALSLIKKLADKVVVESVKASRAHASYIEDMKALRHYQKLIDDNMRARHFLLDTKDVVDEENLPNLTVQDITGEMLLEHHKRIGAADENATIEDLVNIIGDTEIDIK